MSKRFLIGSLSALMLAMTLPASAATSIKFMLDGKEVKSIPVDKLGNVTIKVDGGGQSFKQIWNGQWQGIDQSLNLVAMPYGPNKSAPGLDSSHNWKGYSMSRTGYDANWVNQKVLDGKMEKAARVDGLALFDAMAGQDLIFSTRFRRKVYTGKTIYKDGGYVKETRWETAGPPQGQAIIKLTSPTFAASLDPNNLFAGAIQKFNTPPESEYKDNRAMLLSRTLLYPNSYGGRKVDFKGSKILGFSSAEGKPEFNWNYLDSDNSQWIYAKFPVKMQIQAVMNTKFDSMPLPSKTDVVFDCPIDIAAKRQIGTSTWVTDDLNFNGDTLEACRSKDGKTPAQVAETAKSPIGGTVGLPDADSAADAAKDLLKGFGF